jgi:hypothetical protein
MNPNYPKKSDARAHTRITREWFCPKTLHLFNRSRNQWVGSRITLHPAFIALHRKAMREIAPAIPVGYDRQRRRAVAAR